ncbi:MAG: ABC transporter permease [Acidobacteria bacterium]|nr:ABC transporter permease [Acidobacteriota bacterium]
MTRRTAGALLLGGLVLAFVAAPVLAPNEPARQFPGQAYAPPMRPRLIDDGGFRRPFVYPLIIVNRLERRFREDHVRPLTLEFFTRGRAVTTGSPEPLLLLGADPLGRDVLARLLSGGRRSLGVAAVAVLITLIIGSVAGAAAGFVGGRLDRVVTAIADFVVVLPMIYAVVTLRASLPLFLPPSVIFWSMAAVMAAASWPLPARGVRAIIAAERRKPYAEAAYAAGAGPLRILLRHLLPAAAGHVAVQGLLLFPAFIFAEAMLSFVGLGFAEPSASWGVMLRDAARIPTMIEAPWLLSPAAAIVVTVLATRMLTAGPDESLPLADR